VDSLAARKKDEEETDEEEEEEEERRGGNRDGDGREGAMAMVPVVHRFPDLEKKKLRNADCCSGLLATFSKKKKKNIWRRREIEEEEECRRRRIMTTRRRTSRGLCLVFRPSVHRRSRISIVKIEIASRNVSTLAR